MKRNETKESINRSVSGVIVEQMNEVRRSACEDAIQNIAEDRYLAQIEMDAARESIHDVIATNRGSYKGVHGFIGERAQCAKCNADALVMGKTPIYKLLDDNGPIDYMKGNIPVQQKACMTKGVYGLAAVGEHTEKYDWFVTSDGIYQIPKDFYDGYQKYSNMSPEIAGKLRNEGYRQYLEVQEFNNNHPTIKIEPMEFTYREIQKGNIDATLDRVDAEHDKVACDRMHQVRSEFSANFKECVKASAYSAVIEGVTDGVFSLVGCASERSGISNLNIDDCKEAGLAAAKGAGRGAIRGSAVYVLTNIGNMSAPMASAVVEGGIKTCSLISRYVKDEIDGKECGIAILENGADVIANTSIAFAAGKLATNLLPAKLRPIGIIAGTVIGGNLYHVMKEGIKKKIDKVIPQEIAGGNSASNVA